MHLLKLEFLGQIRITADQPLELASDKMAALLAYLAITGDNFSRPQLEALLWGESSPEKAQTSLRTAVYNINKRLGPVLATNRKTVAFAPKRPFSLDYTQFHTLLAQGDTASLQTAVSLYRGDFLAGLTVADAPEFENWLLRQREQLRLHTLTALETLSQRHLAAGHYPQAIQACRQLLTIESWRESSHRQLMLLLARSGDYNAAIKQYQQCRQMLADELGIPPMPETEALYQRILALRQRPPKLYLPAPPAPLLGRHAELATLTNLLATPSCRLITITGMGGIGKTSLAMVLASQQARHFLDGVVFVSLAGLENEALVDLAVADKLGISFPPNVEPRRYLCEQLQARELLLILDNAEPLLTAVTPFVQAVLEAAPASKIVVTSRETIPLRAAHAFPLAGLPYPDKTETAVLDTPATTLFAQQARRRQPTFSLQQAWSHVVELCHLLQGSPLGIELAAAQLATTPCAELVTQLQAAALNLAVDFQDMPQRHRSLRALFGHSWQQLAANEQAALAKLAVFRASFTSAAARQITDTTAAELRALVAKSLLTMQAGRFQLHPLIRQFAHAQLSPETAVYARHAHYFSQQLAASATKIDAPSDELLTALDDIRAMWQYVVAQADCTLLATATHGLARLYAISNQFVEGELRFGEAVAALAQTAVPHTAPAAWGMLLGRYGMFQFRTGKLAAAHETTAKSVAILRQANDEDALAFSLNLLGILHIQRGEFQTAVSLLTETADLYRRAANPEPLLKPLINLGSVHMRMGNHDTAITFLNEALPLAKQLGDKRGRTHILNNLGANHLVLGDLEGAHHYFAACLPLTEETGYQSVRLVVLQNLAEVCYKQGKWAAAADYCAASMAAARTIDDRLQIVRTQKIQALVYAAQGEHEAAWSVLRDALTAGLEAELVVALLDVLAGAGELLLAAGKTAVAVATLQFVANHPATEQQYVREATALLAQHGGVEEGEKRPLTAVVAQVLAEIEPQG